MQEVTSWFLKGVIHLGQPLLHWASPSVTSQSQGPVLGPSACVYNQLATMLSTIVVLYNKGYCF